ncbi:unnamed protein product [Rhizophagus irregularis]|uniref:Uncharacterized protein n=1 Tax=Rhizophagus irregularis TaxID=588596 RepID=A0A916E403_9GLOM|nr:unnamed protein product [Rhizophagus irregularis]
MNICARFQIQDLEYLETRFVTKHCCHEHLLAFSQSDQRTTLKAVCYKSFFVMNICSLFHNQTRGVLRNCYITNHILS